jgi:hypothetical protein
MQVIIITQDVSEHFSLSLLQYQGIMCNVEYSIISRLEKIRHVYFVILIPK